MIERLFVYGTLGPNRPNAHILTDIGGTWQKASVTGKLLEQGWGSEMGYPGIVLDNGDNRIEGFIFSSKHLTSYWQALDNFEGHGYLRTKTKAQLENNTEIDVYIYVLV